MMPAMAMIPRRIRITTAVAGLIATDGMPVTGSVEPRNVEAPSRGGLDYMKEVSVTVGRAGRLSVHTLDERALGMRGTENILLPACIAFIDHGEWSLEGFETHIRHPSRLSPL